VPDVDPVLDLKRRVADRLLAVAGVAGVGAGGGALRIYLEQDTADVRRVCEEILRAAGASVPVTFVVTGRFRPQQG
jgi:hypothetical protein